jgi:photosystem II stability/assembly factor-like uncharacterized protein
LNFYTTGSTLAKSVLVAVVALLTVCANAAEEAEPFHRFWPDNLFAVDFVTEHTGFIAGQGGTVLRTIDGGESWDALYVSENQLIRRVSFISEKEGWAVGHRGSIFHTTDAGNSWEVQFEVAGNYLRDITFVDENHGWVVGHGATILHTTDGGASWQVQQMRGFTGRDLPRFHGIYAKDENAAIVVGEFGTVVHTEDAGELWSITPGVVGTTWLAVEGGGDFIYLAGLDGNAGYLEFASDLQREEFDREKAELIVKEEAKARKKAKRRKKEYIPRVMAKIPRSSIEYAFTPIDSGTKEHLFDLASAPDGSVVVVGRSTVLRLNNKGAEKFKVAVDIPLDFIWLGGVTVTPAGSVWAAGIRGLVVRGDVSTMSIRPALSLGLSDNVHLVVDRWAVSNGQ